MADTDNLPSNSYIPDRGGLGRPVDRGQETSERSDHVSRRIPPHGDVSPEGDRAWPRPSMTSRVVVYGGTALAAAAATAAAVLAVKKVADVVTGNDELDRDADEAAERARVKVYDEASGRRSAPRYVAMSEREREAMRARARDRMRQEEIERDRLRANARRNRDDERDAPRSRPRPPRPAVQPMGFLDDVEHTAKRLSRTVNEVAAGINAAVAAFRSVSTQAEQVMREFSGTAEQVRSFLGTGSDSAGARRDPYRRPRRSDVVDLRDTAEAMPPTNDPDARTHRL
jgi:hypothetical protein